MIVADQAVVDKILADPRYTRATELLAGEYGDCTLPALDGWVVKCNGEGDFASCYYTATAACEASVATIPQYIKVDAEYNRLLNGILNLSLSLEFVR